MTIYLLVTITMNLTISTVHTMMQKHLHYQAAYTMGGATFRIAEVDIENRAYGTASADVDGTCSIYGSIVLNKERQSKKYE